MILNTRSPNCVEYRDAYNEYFQTVYPELKCQIQCSNQDYFYARELPNWYIPNNSPIEDKDCGKIVDDCNYRFDSKYFFGNKFYELLLDAENFVKVITRRYSMLLCR